MSNFKNYVRRRIIKYIKSIEDIKDDTPIEEYMKVFNKIKHE